MAAESATRSTELASPLKWRIEGPFDSSYSLALVNRELGRALEEEHLLITVTRDTVIRLLPPLVCDERQIDDIVARVARLLSPSMASSTVTAETAAQTEPVI